MIRTVAEPRPPERVLIIKPSALGDVVTAIPVLRGLRRSYPEARISWLISDNCAALIRHDPQLDEVIIFRRKHLGRAWRSISSARGLVQLLRSLRNARFEWVIDLQGLLRSGIFTGISRAPLRAGFSNAREGASIFYNVRIRPGPQHTVERNIALARELGIDARPADMRLEVSSAGHEFTGKLCASYDLHPSGYLVCVPPTTWSTKIYPVRNWRKVIEELSRKIPIVLLGSADDREFCRRIADGLQSGVTDLTGQTTIEELVGVIAGSAGVICSDSAAKFIAAAVGVECVTLIGPTQVSRTGPYLRGKAIVADVPCQGCLKRRCRHITCMQSIDPADVISAADAMLGTQRK